MNLCPCGYTMSEHFKILSRKDRAPILSEYDTVVGLNTKNFNEPLCGFSNYTEDIPLGTVVGVQLQTNEITKLNYEASFCLKEEIKNEITITHFEDDQNEKAVYCPEKILEYQNIYEYFFKITGFDPENNIYSIEPVFLHENKVLCKGIKLSLDENVPMKAEFFFERASVVTRYFDHLKRIGKSTRNFKEFYFSEIREENFIDLKGKIGTIGRKEMKNKLINNVLPFTGNYRNVVILEEPANLEGLKKFFAVLEENSSFFESILGRKMVENLGSEQMIRENFEKLYNEAVSETNGISSVEIYFSLLISEALVPSTLNVSELKSIKRNDVFRVYLDDPVYNLVPSTRVTDWNFIKISPAILGYLQPGNIVRVLIGTNDGPGVFNKDYVVILDRIDSNSFFASHFDMYSNNDENILLVITVDSIIEIPLTWEDNENLEQVIGSLSPPEQIETSVLYHALTYGFRRTSLDYDPSYYNSLTYMDMVWK